MTTQTAISTPNSLPAAVSNRALALTPPPSNTPPRSRPAGPSSAPTTLPFRRDASDDFAAVLLGRAGVLTPSDRALIKAVYGDNLSIKAAAKLRVECPRSVRRRLNALTDRMLSSLFRFVLLERHNWEVTRRRIAAAYVLEGRTLRQTAEHVGVSFYQVRRQMAAVRLLHDVALATKEIHR